MKKTSTIGRDTADDQSDHSDTSDDGGMQLSGLTHEEDPESLSVLPVASTATRLRSIKNLNPEKGNKETRVNPANRGAGVTSPSTLLIKRQVPGSYIDYFAALPRSTIQQRVPKSMSEEGPFLDLHLKPYVSSDEVGKTLSLCPDKVA